MLHEKALTFEALYNTHYVRVRNFLRIYLADASVVEDIAQDTFLQFWQSPSRFNPDRFADQRRGPTAEVVGRH
jgi:DNA-directed RNA polymerase specialized sigma24 family protein